MGDYVMAYVLIGVIGLIMLFCFLKMHEYLKQINEKMNTIISEMKDMNKNVTDKSEKIVDNLIITNRTIRETNQK